MRLGIISDIHANEEALDAVLKCMGPVDRIVCLGDVVGYGPSPESCISMLREAGIDTILGNHELGLLKQLDRSCFSDVAEISLDWQRDQISRESLDWIKSLPKTIEMEEVMLVHGAPPFSQTDYVSTEFDAGRAMCLTYRRACLVGHSHIPAFFVHRDGKPSFELANWKHCQSYTNMPNLFGKNNRILANPGSVGQPRDRSALASFAVLDMFRGEFCIHRVEYQVKKTQAKLKRVGLPTELADRLARGR